MYHWGFANSYTNSVKNFIFFRILSTTIHPTSSINSTSNFYTNGPTTSTTTDRTKHTLGSVKNTCRVVAYLTTYYLYATYLGQDFKVLADNRPCETASDTFACMFLIRESHRRLPPSFMFLKCHNQVSKLHFEANPSFEVFIKKGRVFSVCHVI